MEATGIRHDYERRRAAQANLPFVALEPHLGAGDPLYNVDPQAARMVSERVCRQFQALPLTYHDGVVTVAIADPFDELARSVVAGLLSHAVQWVVADADEIARATEAVFGVPRRVEREFEPAIVGEADSELYEALGARPPMRVGELLLARKLISEDQLVEALIEQQRTGSRVGDILVHNTVVSEHDALAVLAEQFELPLIDIDTIDPEAVPLDAIPEPLARQLRCVPIGVDERTLYLAVADAIDDEAAAALREHTDLELRSFLASANEIDVLLQRIHRDAYVNAATGELLERFPEKCANRVITAGQRAFFLLLGLAFVVGLVLAPIPTLVVFVAASSVFYTAASLYKFKLIYGALGHEYEVEVLDKEIAAIDERQLPIYTILIPLFKEANVVPQLVAGIGELDYPKTKLDVRLLCEENDEETIATVRDLELPPHFKLVIVPESAPQTKPKACNFGLLQAEGDITVIYDAEDRPDPDQLKKAVLAFQKADPRVACVQAKLNYFNQDQNMLTRWFASEYSLWFDLLLPGLDAEDVPIPLGGTSNHFITARLVMLAAWDPFNVTEDADLGIRLHTAGYQTAMIDSTTLEEANSVLNNWIRQRSRWIKGYIQTWLVHMRHPFRLLRQLGPRSFISFNLLVGGTFIFLLNPIFWFLTTAFFFTQASVIQELFPSFIFYLAAAQLFVGNFVFLYLNLAGTMQRGYFNLTKYALFVPFYWGLMSVAAWKGFVQLFTNPFFWEKTHHGLTGNASQG